MNKLRNECGLLPVQVDENPLNERESLMQQQSPHNTQQGSHLTNERLVHNVFLDCNDNAFFFI